VERKDKVSGHCFQWLEKSEGHAEPQIPKWGYQVAQTKFDIQIE
jgi:hypothetical protein